MFDIFLPCAPKDFNKLPFCVNAIGKYIKEFDKIYICVPKDIPADIKNKIKVKYKLVYDSEVLPIDRNDWKFRPNWLFQQHVKLFQEITQDWYLTIDSDIIVNREMKFFEKNKPIYYMGQDQFFCPYFIFQTLMIGLPKVNDHTYVADMNLIYRPIINEILERNGYNRMSFIKKSQEITDKWCCMGEPELYGSYVKKYYPNMYIERKLKQYPYGGRPQKNINELKWNENEIKEMMEKTKNIDVDVLSIHSWLDEGDQK
uniref:Nucleotide-diphospho-sugar transferase domain-containing protein n=1 Tax=viral metagenome TaxID=1070528 RepID=A0A6M3LY57_9ZZZZ